ncbi:MAG: RagB/SusD family nutrient uptake outer membrane protein [Paludibacter sp.]|nr:RagB/SusD family nutrient uptake outer membrane protein [Paludibacter sp.]
MSITCSLFAFYGCTDYLNKEVLGYSTLDNYYQTPYQLQEALNGTYNILQSDLFMNTEWIFGEACSDDVIGNDESTTDQISQLVNFNFTPSNTWILNRYTVNYQGISRANQVIANVNKVKLASTDYGQYSTVRYILGQAKFLRALFYFNLVKTYGGVPIRPEVEKLDSLVIPRSTKEEVYAYIEKDLREAIIMLPPQFTGTDLGHAGSGAAIGLLMKVLMYEAKPGEVSTKWSDIVDLGKYFIDGNSMKMGQVLKYDSTTENWESLRERLWFKPKALLASTDPLETPNTQLSSIANLYGINYSSYYNTPIAYWQIFNQTGEFYRGSIFEVVFKESADGTTGDQNQGTAIFQDLWQNRLWTSPTMLTDLLNDPRINQVIAKHGTSTPDGERVNTVENRWNVLKWYCPIAQRPQNTTDYGENRRVIRYADVVLIYAEALNEMNQGAQALTQLNKSKIAANAITGTATIYIGGGYGYMRNQIWQERRMELCFEWDRFFDLVRQGRAASVLHAFASASATNNQRGKNFIEGVNEIFPIPQNEIDISNGVVTQNPGY